MGHHPGARVVAFWFVAQGLGMQRHRSGVVAEMELKQLEMFVAVVEERSILKAADRVYRTQPAVSIALKKLEEEVGEQIFDRGQRYEYLLTPAGDVLYTHAKRVLNLIDETRRSLEDLAKVRRGQLRIGASESINLYLLPAITHVFRKRYPYIRFEVACKHSDELLRMLKERRLDLALLAYKPKGSDVEARQIMRDELVLITSPSHRLAKPGSAQVQDLSSESFIMEGGASSMRDTIEEVFKECGTPLNIEVESGAIETIKRMVAMGLGIGFVPLMCVKEEVARGELAVVSVEGLRIERKLWVARRRSDAHSQAAKAFQRIVLTLADKGGWSEPSLGIEEVRYAVAGGVGNE